MQYEVCRQWSRHVSRVDHINRVAVTARSEHHQEWWRAGQTAKKDWVWVGGGLAQSEINNSTLIHHKPVITARPPVAKAFHSE